MPGPLPKANKQRRNAPTIPSTELPAAGRAEPAPKCPYELGKAAGAWWEWAWTLPQATAWDDGALYFVARRALLEDDLAGMTEAEGFELGDYLDVSKDEWEVANQVSAIFRAIKKVAGGSTAIAKEMRELDNRLGLNPKGLADLRWKITGEEAAGEIVDHPTARKRHLRAT